MNQNDDTQTRPGKVDEVETAARARYEQQCDPPSTAVYGIYEVEGGYVISSGGVRLPGSYATRYAAHLAFRLPDATLQRLQDEANTRAGGTGGTITLDDVLSIRVHPTEQCAGRPCVVHAPSDHHMRDWPKHYRPDRHLTERICPHGIGHPDPDDLAWHKSEGREWQGVHGCDGCCVAPTSSAVDGDE